MACARLAAAFAAALAVALPAASAHAAGPPAAPQNLHAFDLRADAAVTSGAPSEVRGAAVWARQAVAFGHLAQLVRPALVNGAIGVVMAPNGRLVRALRFTIAKGRITEIEVIGEPARLGELDFSIVE